MIDRSEYATARDGDVALLRSMFERGTSYTREQAQEHLGIADRRFRAAIAALRAEGYPVVSWSNEGSVYRKAHDVEEMDRFIDTELLPRMRKIDREARAMRTNGRTYFRVHQTQLI